MVSFFGKPGLWHGVSAARQDRIREAVRKEIEAEVRDEMAPKVERDVEKRLEPTIRNRITKDVEANYELSMRSRLAEEARVQIQKEMEARVPTPRERATFKSFAREIEVDALTQAQTASDMADKAIRAGLRLRRTWGLLVWLGSLSAIPGLYSAYHFFQLGWVSLAVAATTTLMTLVALFFRNKSVDAMLKATWKQCSESSSDFLILAEQAKRLRIVTASNADTRDALNKDLNSLQREKTLADRRFNPSITDIEETRQKVRARIVVDDSELVRLDEEREAIAEAEAEVGLDEARSGTVGRS